jgi:CTD small phosphatase-like protein 2
LTLENFEEVQHLSLNMGSKFKDLEGIEIDYVEASQNFQGNYSNYVYEVLRSITPLMKLNYSTYINKRRVACPKGTGKKTLVLDLDETLIHADFDKNFQGHDHVITFLHEGEELTVPIFVRPGIQEFLEKASQNFEIFVFTASKKVYADTVLNFLDPDGRIFKTRYYREDCIKVGSKVYVKDLRIFDNRKLEDIILVDNSMYSFANQISNGVLINSFYNDQEDKELHNVLNYLDNYLRDVSDIRLINEKVFNFTDILDGIAKEIYV